MANIITNTNENKLREDMVRIGGSLFQRGLTAGSSGNISVRCENNILITPTNSCLGELDPAKISLLNSQNQLISGQPPSKELFLHSKFYENRKDAGGIVHLHSTHSSAVSCLSGLNCDDCLPPLTAYYIMKIGTLPLIPYFRPGDINLADEISKRAIKNSAVLLANHGPVVSGKTLTDAVYAIEELEETAKIFLLLQGMKLSLLTNEQIEELNCVFKR